MQFYMLLHNDRIQSFRDRCSGHDTDTVSGFHLAEVGFAGKGMACYLQAALAVLGHIFSTNCIAVYGGIGMRGDVKCRHDGVSQCALAGLSDRQALITVDGGHISQNMRERVLHSDQAGFIYIGAAGLRRNHFLVLGPVMGMPLLIKLKKYSRLRYSVLCAEKGWALIC